MNRFRRLSVALAVAGVLGAAAPAAVVEVPAADAWTRASELAAAAGAPVWAGEADAGEDGSPLGGVGLSGVVGIWVWVGRIGVTRTGAPARAIRIN